VDGRPHGKIATVRALIVVVAGLVGCVGSGTFRCVHDPDCGPGGTCEPSTNLCSFADGKCASGQRYGAFAGDLSHSCVGGGTGAKCGGPPVVTDDFEDGVTAPAWGAAFDDGVASYAETGGQLTIHSPANTSGNHYAGYLMSTAFDLRNDAAWVEVPKVCDVSGHGDTYMRLSAQGDNHVAIEEENGEIFFARSVNGVETDVGQATYDPSAMLWWRIRETAGTVFWETGPDGTTWNIGASQPDPIDLSGVYPQLVAGAYQAEPLGVDAAFDNYNGGGAPPETWCPLDHLTDAFAENALLDVWTSDDSDPGCAVAIANGQAVLTLPTTAPGYCDASTTSIFDLRNSHAEIHVIGSPLSSPSTDQFIQVRDANSGDHLEIGLIQGAVHFADRVNGTYTSVVDDVPYDASTMSWWRIREAGGVTYWETSGDATTWTVQAMLADPIADSEVTFRFGAGADVTLSNAGTAIFDDVNPM
jgi:hypothetical protein